MRTAGIVDQAAGLRRLFAPAAPRVLPLMLAGDGAAARCYTAWIARCAEAFARAGQQTVLVDAARLQVADALGLRARFDLAHALAGECGIDSALLDAGGPLRVLPAWRALEQLSPGRPKTVACPHGGRTRSGRGRSYEPLSPGRPGTLACPHGAPTCSGRGPTRDAAGAPRTAFLHALARSVPVQTDLVLLALPDGRAAAIGHGDAVLPLLAERQAFGAQLDALGRAAGLRAAAGQTGTFRLLFLGMDPGAAATLAQRLTDSRAAQIPLPVACAAVAPLVRDLAAITSLAAGWDLARLPVIQRRCGE